MDLLVEDAFKDFKSKLELSKTFQDAVSTHHNALRSWIELNNPNIETQLIGSLQRKTRIQPCNSDNTFDIDILVGLGDFKRWVSSGGVTPTDALDNVENVVSQSERYRRIGPETNSPAIVLEYSDGIEIELIPAYLDNIGQYSDGTITLPKGRGYWIPKKGKWEIADYNYDAEYITRMNTTSDSYLVPLIKMLKAAKRNLFSQLSSYHLEILASTIVPLCIKNSKEKGLEISYPFLIYSFFYLAQEIVKLEAKIAGSKSPNADANMTPSEKQNMADQFEKISNYCGSVLKLQGVVAIKAWNQLFGYPFPTGG